MAGARYSMDFSSSVSRGCSGSCCGTPDSTMGSGPDSLREAELESRFAASRPSSSSGVGAMGDFFGRTPGGWISGWGDEEERDGGREFDEDIREGG